MECGCFSWMGDKILAMYHWHIMGKYFIFCGSTTQWYLFKGAFQLIKGTEKANHCASFGYKWILKKQPFKSIISKFQSLGIIVGEGKPGCRCPIFSILVLTLLRSWRRCHFSLCSFLITNMGVFQGLVAGSWNKVTFVQLLFSHLFKCNHFLRLQGPMTSPDGPLWCPS